MKPASLLIPALILTAAVVVFSCSKSNTGGKPKISLKSLTTDIPQGGSLDLKLNVTPGDAKLAGGTFLFIRDRINQLPLPVGTPQVDTVRSTIPDFDQKNTQEFEYQQGYNYMHQGDTQPDTVIIKVAVIDVAGKSSDTLTTQKVVVH